MKIKYLGGNNGYKRAFELCYREKEQGLFDYVRKVLIAEEVIDKSKLTVGDSYPDCNSKGAEVDIIRYIEEVEDREEFEEIKELYLKAKKEYTIIK